MMSSVRSRSAILESKNYSLCPTWSEGIVSESSVLGGLREQSGSNMKKESAKKHSDELKPEYDLSKLRGGVRGKYFAQASAGTNLVLIEPDLAALFPDGESVNRALRLLADTARAVTPRRAKRR